MEYSNFQCNVCWFIGRCQLSYQLPYTLDSCHSFSSLWILSVLSGSVQRHIAQENTRTWCKVKRGNSDIILTPRVIPTLECSSSFIQGTKLKTAMHIAVLLTYTETKNHRLTPQYAVDISATIEITAPSGLFRLTLYCIHLGGGGGRGINVKYLAFATCVFIAGRLIPTGHILGGRGGSAVVHISCSGCGAQIQYASSAMSATESRRNVVSYALRIAAFVSGVGFTGYHKLFGRHLGMSIATDKMFRVIEEAYPHITEMLDEVCELGKDEMKALPSDKLGSWQRAVTTSDGCWHIRGFFQNCTVVISN